MTSVHPNRRKEFTLVVTSQERSIQGTNTHFSVHLNNSSRTQNVVAAHLLHAHVPQMFDNVRAGNNTFTVTMASTVTGEATKYTITIPTAYYSLAELITAFNNAMTPYNIQVVHDPSLHLMSERLMLQYTPTPEVASLAVVDEFNQIWGATFPPENLTFVPKDTITTNGGALGLWFTVKKKTKLNGVQSINPGIDTSNIPTEADITYAPHPAVTAATDGITGIVTSSTIFGTTNNVWGPFDKSYGFHSSSIWNSGSGLYDPTTRLYLGSVFTEVDGVDIYGEWVQLQFMSDYLVKSAYVQVSNTSGPTSFVIAGSRDGGKWFTLHEETAASHYQTTYTFSAAKRARFVRLIVRESEDTIGRALWSTCDLSVAEPFRQVWEHDLYRLDYLDPDFGNVSLRPSETDRIAALDPANASQITQTLVADFRTEELSRAGNVATHQFIDSNGDAYDPNIILEPGYYFVIDNHNSVEGGWAFDVDIDWGGSLNGQNSGWAQSSYTGDLAWETIRSDLKLALGAGEQATTGPIIYPYVFTNYTLEPFTFKTATLTSDNAGEDGDLLTSVMGVADNTTLASDENGSSVTTPSPFNLNGPDAVLLNSVCFASSNSIGAGSGDGFKLDTRVVDMVTMRGTPRGQYTWYQPADASANLIRYPYSKDITNIDFEITDTHGRPLHLPANYHVTVVMRLIQESLDGV
jgi:hypothetical protein